MTMKLNPFEIRRQKQLKNIQTLALGLRPSPRGDRLGALRLYVTDEVGEEGPTKRNVELLEKTADFIRNTGVTLTFLDENDALPRVLATRYVSGFDFFGDKNDRFDSDEPHNSLLASDVVRALKEAVQLQQRVPNALELSNPAAI